VPAEPVIAAVLENPVVPVARAALVAPEDLVVPVVRAALAVPEDLVVPVVRAALVVPENRVASVALAVPVALAELANQVASVVLGNRAAQAALAVRAAPAGLANRVALELVPVVAVPVLDQVEAQRRIRSATAAHHRGQVPLLAAEDLAAVAETTREPAAIEVVVAWVAAG
jgi:hypothetical protein